MTPSPDGCAFQSSTGSRAWIVAPSAIVACTCATIARSLVYQSALRLEDRAHRRWQVVAWKARIDLGAAQHLVLEPVQARRIQSASEQLAILGAAVDRSRRYQQRLAGSPCSASADNPQARSCSDT